MILTLIQGHRVARTRRCLSQASIKILNWFTWNMHDVLLWLVSFIGLILISFNLQEITLLILFCQNVLTVGLPSGIYTLMFFKLGMTTIKTTRVFIFDTLFDGLDLHSRTQIYQKSLHLFSRKVALGLLNVCNDTLYRRADCWKVIPWQISIVWVLALVFLFSFLFFLFCLFILGGGRGCFLGDGVLVFVGRLFFVVMMSFFQKAFSDDG